VAAQAQVPIVPAVVQGTSELLGHAFRKGLNVRFGQPVTVQEIPGEPNTGKVAYRALATTIMSAIRKLADTTGERRSQAVRKGEMQHAGRR
jgi:1-acyl-sn-glycerol-3-phosphate acyltransferase